MLKNLSVKTKLKMYFFSLIFFIMLVSSSAIFFISKIENSAQDLYYHPYQVSVASIETESEINHMFSVMQIIANSEDQNIINAQTEVIEEIELKIERNIEIFHQFYLGDKNSVLELEEEYLESKANRIIVIDYLKNSEFDSAKEFMLTNGGTQKALILDKVYIIKLFASNKADELSETALAQASLYTHLIIGFLTIVILFSIGLVVYIIRDLIPPLDKLLKTIESYKKDENKSVLDLDRKDELGIISNNFNEMLSYMKTKQEKEHLDLELSKVKNAKELLKTQILLKASLESPKDLIILSLDTEYKYLFFNNTHRISMRVAYGADVKEGKCIFDYMTSKSDIRKVKENYDKALSGETHTKIEEYGEIEKSYYEVVYSPIINELKEIIGVSSFARDITLRVQQQQLLKDSEESLRTTQSLLNLSINSQKNTIMISLDKNYKYLYFNKPHFDAMKEIYGKEIETGVCIFDYMTSQDDIQRAKENYDITLSGKSHKSLEQYGDKVINYYESSYSPIISNSDEIIGVSIFTENVTERILQQQLLEESEERFKILHNASFGGIAIHNKGIILDCNQGLSNLTGFTMDDLIGMDGLLLIAPNYREYVMEKITSGFEEPYEGKGIRKNGEIYPLKLEARNIPFQGKIVRVVEFRDVTELKQKEEELIRISYRDQLTSLYNRRFFEEQLTRLDNPRNLPLSIIMGDVNGLKLINDAFGHQAGDKLLELIGDVISKSIRGNDVASRWGGDEFTILLPNSDADAAQVLINRIQKKISDTSFEYSKISISFGLYTKKEKHEEIDRVFKLAEELMYQNKLVEIDSIRGQTINTIMTTLFEKSAQVKEHSMRVSELSASIAEKMELSRINTNDIKTMGLIHDVGKIVIDLHILEKPGKLTEEERKIIEQHPLSGSRMLNSSHEYARLAAGVLHHHERIDGKGYPNGITRDQIPIESKIIAVADAYDAMIAERPYRLNPLSVKEAIAELQKHSGTQFDETVVDVFVNKVLANQG